MNEPNSYVYRTMIAAEIVAKRAGANALVESLRKLCEAFERETGCGGTGDPERVIQRLKSPKPPAS